MYGFGKSSQFLLSTSATHPSLNALCNQALLFMNILGINESCSSRNKGDCRLHTTLSTSNNFLYQSRKAYQTLFTILGTCHEVHLFLPRAIDKVPGLDNQYPDGRALIEVRTKTFLALHTRHTRFRTLPVTFMSVTADIASSNINLPSACTTSGANSMPNLDSLAIFYKSRVHFNTYI